MPFETNTDVSDAHAAMDAAGNAWVFYTRTAGLYARRHTIAGGWGSVASLGGGEADELVANPSGVVLAGAIWSYYVPTPAFMNSATAHIYLP